MNQIFNFRRFGRYYVTDLRRCMANYGLSALVTALIGIIAYVFTGLISTILGGEWLSLPLAARIMIFGIAALVLIINMPSKCYGFITDKQAGSNWILTPVSVTEKYISMLLNTLLVIPLVFVAVYFAIDSLIVFLDPDLDTSLISAFINAFRSVGGFLTEINADLDPAELQMFDQIGNKISLWSGTDDIMNIILSFLLGAVFFKRNKAAKTILAWIVLSMAFSIILTPLMVSFGMNFISQAETLTTEADVLYWLEDNIGAAMIFDTVLDLAMFLILSAAIFFRIKTIKH